MLQVSEARQKLDGEPTDQPILKALIVVHFDELVQVDGVEVEHNAQMVPPHEVVLKLDDALYLVWVVFLEKEEELGLDSRLVVIFLLVFDHFDGDHLA